MPKISVIIPVYNVEEYLPKCLDSVINQTLKDIEIICIDDGSTDNSLEILKSYADKDDRIIVLNQETNQGQGVARNRGLDIAKGEYVGFVDPDDWVALDMYEKMYNQAKDLDSEIVICDYQRYHEVNGKYTNTKFFENYLSPLSVLKVDMPANINIDKEEINKTLLLSPCYSCNRIYKTSLLKHYDIYFSTRRCYEDCIFIVKSHIQAKNISYISQIFYTYRIHDNSTLRRITWNEKDKYLLDTYKDIVSYLNNINNISVFKKNLKYFLMIGRYCIYTREQSQKERNKYIKYLKSEMSKRDFKLLEKKCHRTSSLKKILHNLFSITNNKKNKRQKILTILGIKIKFKYLKGQLKKEQYFIDKIKQNQKKYPKDTYLLFDNLNGDIAECIDAYSLYKYMKSQGKNAYYVLLKDSPLYEKLSLDRNLENIITLDNPITTNSGDFFEAIYQILLRTKVIITSFGFGCTAAGQKFIKNNKYWRYIFIQHGQIFLKETVMKNGYLSPKRFDKILISSEYEHKIFQKYNWPEEKLLKGGLPRWDLLEQNNQPDEKSIFVMFTWRRFSCGEFAVSKYRENIIRLLSNENLQNVLKQKNIKLYFAPHHSLFGLRGIKFDFNLVNIILVDSTCISKYIRQCSCLVTDWSSVAFDFMFQNKPVIYYILDKDDKTLGKFDSEDIRHFEYKKYIMPNIFYEEEEVINKLINYVENDFKLELEIERKYKEFFYTKENIREKLTNEIDKICMEE